MTLVDQHQGIFDEATQGYEKACADGPVHGAVIAAHRNTHTLSRLQLAFHYHRMIFSGSDRENSDFRRIDDRRELIDLHHAEVAERERGPGVLLWLELA